MSARSGCYRGVLGEILLLWSYVVSPRGACVAGTQACVTGTHWKCLV